MATLSNPVFYYNQATQLPTSQTGAVGWGGKSSGLTGGNCTRIVRYTLTTGANESALEVSIKLLANNKIKWLEGTSNITDDMVLLDYINDQIDLYFLIGTGATEYIAAGRDFVSVGKYTGKAYIDAYYDTSSGSGHNIDNLRFNIQLDGKCNLEPNTTYYLWIFPGYAYADGTYGVFEWDDKISSSSFVREVSLWTLPYFETNTTRDFTMRVYYDASVPGYITIHTVQLQSKTYNSNWFPKGTIKINDETVLEMDYKAPATHMFRVNAPGETWYDMDIAVTGSIPLPVTNKTEITTSPATIEISVQLYRDGNSPTPNLYGTSNAALIIGGYVYIDNGSGWDAYEIYIDNGTGWDRYQAYIDNGSSWDPY